LNLLNVSFSVFPKSTISLLVVLLFTTYSNSQFIQNEKGQFVKEELFFNPIVIKNKNIKSIKVSFLEKKQLKGIYQTDIKSNHFSFDNWGRIKRVYKTYRTDTTVEWRYYKDNKISAIKKGSNNVIKVKSIFYENDKPIINIIATSINESQDVTILKIKNYREESAEYINYKKLQNGDSLIEWSYTGKSIFKKLLISKKDSLTIKETYSFPLKSLNYHSYEYNYLNKLLSKLIVVNSSSYYYHFIYDSNQELIKYSKFDSKLNSEIETCELLYEKETGNLQAIITKNKLNNSIKIRKFNYTYF